LDLQSGGADLRPRKHSTEYAHGYLKEVNDRGIVLTVEGHGEYPARPLFFPWGAVIQLSEASDE
jgi:hypothetical protein